MRPGLARPYMDRQTHQQRADVHHYGAAGKRLCAATVARWREGSPGGLAAACIPKTAQASDTVSHVEVK